MPYMMSDNGKCVHRQNADGSMGDVVKCHDTAEQAKAHMAALYANVEDAAAKENLFIAGDAELSAAELQAIERLYQDIGAGRVKLESLTEPEEATGKASVSYGNREGGSTGPAGNPTGTPGWRGLRGNSEERCFLHVKRLGGDETTARKICRNLFGGASKAARHEATFAVYKQADGAYRWLAVTSSSFQDRDKEIVSQKALEADAERMNATGDFGTLDWWHTPIVLGACDFSAMHGRLSVESGTFKDSYIAEKMAGGSYEMSRAFYHPITEPDPQGVYHNIKTFSRAVIPQGKGVASNRLTTFTVVKEEKEMLADKIKELVARFGGDKQAEEHVNALLAEAGQKEQAAVDAGIAAKEQKPEAAPEAAPAEAKTEKITDQPGMFVADMKPEEFDAHIAMAINAAVKPLMDQLNALKEANATAVKESSTAVLAAMLEKVGAVEKAQAETAAQVKELNGLTPRGYRASQDPATVTTKDAKPGADEKKPYFEQFVNGFVLGQPKPPVP